MHLATFAGMNSLEARLMVEHVNRKFTATDARLDRMDVRLARLEARLDVLLDRLEAMCERQGAVDAGDRP